MSPNFHFLRLIKPTIAAHKVEFALLFAISALFLFNQSMRSGGDFDAPYDGKISAIFYSLPLFLAFSYSLSGFRLAHHLSLLAPVCAYFFVFRLEEGQNFALGAVAVIMLISKGYERDDAKFVKNALLIIVNLVLAAAISMLFLTLLSTVLGGIGYLFGVDLFDTDVLLALFYALNTLLFLYLTDGNMKFSVSLGSKIFDYLLTPTLLIYAVLLHFYIVKIAASAQLPKGGVAYIVLSYLICGFLLGGIFSVVKSGRWSKFYELFAALCVAPAALLWVGVIRRVSEYGLTPSRIWLICASAFFTLIVAFWLFRRIKFYAVSIAFCAAILALFFVADAKRISLNSQLSRFNLMLESLNVKNKRDLARLDENKIDKLQDLARDLKRLGSELKILDDITEFRFYEARNFYLRLKSGLVLGDTSGARIIYLGKSFYCGEECAIDFKEDGLNFSADLNEHLGKILRSQGELTEDDIEGLADKILIVPTQLGDFVLQSADIRKTQSGYKFSRVEPTLFIKKDQR